MPGTPRRSLIRLASVLAPFVAVLATARAQSLERRPSRPFLVYNGAGHTAPVRSLVFSPWAPLQVLTGGLDRTVNVWNVEGEGAGWVRSIRPPINREPAGTIHALALAPDPNGQGQGLLAVGGRSPMSGSSFIFLYKFPGAKNLSTGEPDGTLPSLLAMKSNPEQAKGVRNYLNGLAFNALGTRLASCGGDSVVVVWDVKAGTILRRLEDADRTHRRPQVNHVVMSRDGKRVWSGGSDGYLRMWEVDTSPKPRVYAYSGPTNRPEPALLPRFEVTALALSPDERFVVAGREDGTLIRYDAATLGHAFLLIPPNQVTGPVEAVTFHPKLPRVGLSRLEHASKGAELPRTRCLVEIRSAETGALLDTAPTVSDIVRACAFDPEGRFLAYSGGEAQSVYLKDLKAGPTRELRGEGSSLAEVRFAHRGERIAVRRMSSGAGSRGDLYEGFDLKNRGTVRLTPAELDPVPPLPTTHEFRITPTDRGKLNAVIYGKPFLLEWDHASLGRWWSYGFLPDPKDPARGWPSVAVGCEDFIAIFAPSTSPNGSVSYGITRHFRGHSGRIDSLAASLDGRWLASGGVDQTVRLWSLPTARVRADLGARLTPNPDGSLTVSMVNPDGFAARADLREGDRILDGWYGQDRFTSGKPKHGVRPMTDLMGLLADSGTIGRPVKLALARDKITTVTTRQNDPVLSLFLTSARASGPGGGDREWVLWNPDGYYDTSVTADRRYLGWHRNSENRDGTNIDPAQPTQYYPIRTFEDVLRKPEVISKLIAGQPRSEALPKGIKIIEEIGRSVPPLVRILDPPQLDGGPFLSVGERMKLQVEVAQGQGFPPSPLGAVRVLVDGQQVAAQKLPRNQSRALVSLDIPLGQPGPHTVVVLASNEAKREQPATFLVEHQPPNPPELFKVPELIVAAIGVNEFHGGRLYPGIPRAVADAEGVLENFFAKPAIQGYYAPKIAEEALKSRALVVVGEQATAQQIQQVFQELRRRATLAAPTPERLGEGDTVALVISSHVMGRDATEPRLVVKDTLGSDLERTSLGTDAISETLGELVKVGCRVIVILDGYHGEPDERRQAGVREWAYRLDVQNVVVCVAALNVPGIGLDDDDPADYSPFFRALFALDPRDPRTGAASRLTLDRFKRLLVERVKAETKEKQEPYINTPRTLRWDTPLFDPPPKPSRLAHNGPRAALLDNR